MRADPSNGWTGGQYSAVRILLGAVLVADSGSAIQEWFTYRGPPLPLTTGLVQALLAGLLMLGWQDRVAAALLILVKGAPLLARAMLPDSPAPLAALGLHLGLPAAPYGSFAARGRLDPAGGWRMPGWVPWAARALFTGWIIYALAAAGGPPPGSTILTAIPLFLLTIDPTWIRPAGLARDLLFYDGGCGLCHRAIRFVLAEDRQGVFRFAPIGSDTFKAMVPPEEQAALPDSIVVLAADRQLRTRSGAMLYIGTRLGGWWRVLATLAWLIPRPLRDAAYDGIARIRKRLFPPPSAACPVLPAGLRDRFLA